ncbi:MAG: YfhO family protein [Pirellulales bacterium]|nr:YfhO family protein [Pirellulales bacterium]
MSFAAQTEITTVVAALAICVVLVWPCLQGRVYLGDDLGAYHVPARAFYARQLAAGERFDWCPEIYGGFFLSAEGQTGTYHPWHLAIYRWLPLNWALALEVIAPYPLAFCGTYLFLRRRWRGPHGRPTAVAGALFFAFSAFNLLHFVHTNAVAVFAHLPWLLWAADRLLRGATARERSIPALSVALLLGSELLLGYPQFVWFSLLAVAIFAVATVENRKRLVGLARLSGAVVLGLLIGGVQWLPTLDLLRHSAREELTSAQLLEGSLHPWSFAELVGPYLFFDRVVGQNTHELACYFGAVPLVLIAWLFARRRELGENTRAFCFGWLLFAAGALALALGKYGFFGDLLAHLPVIGKFRFPSRYVGLATWGVSMAAAGALAALSARCERQRAARVVAAGTSRTLLALVAISTLIAMLAPWLWGNEHLGSLWAVAAGPMLIASAAALVVAAERGYRAALAALMMLAAVDLGAYGLSYEPVRTTGTLAEFANAAIVPPAAPTSGRVVCDLPGAAKLTGDRITLAGYERWDGYAGLAPQRVLDPLRLSTLRLAGVRWVAHSPEAERITGLARRDECWLEVPDPLPKYRLVTQVIVDAYPAQSIEQIDLATCAIVDRSLTEALGSGLAEFNEQPGRVGVRREACGRIELVTRAPTRQLLVVSESYHPGWQARIDGEKVELCRVNGDFLGCPVPAGDHVVDFEFRPESLRWGRGLTLLGLLLAARQFLAGWRATDRARRPARRQIQSTTVAREALPSTG